MNFLSDIWECIKTMIGVLLATAFVFAVVALLFIFVTWICGGFDQDARNKRHQQEAYDATPHLYSEVDGCQVYRWRDNGHWHYFTKCGTKVTTESHHGERVGKSTRDVAEIIETTK